MSTSEDRRKTRIAILFGLLGFSFNLVDLGSMGGSPFAFNFLPGLIFPLLITLSWGLKYGILSALFGGTQAMWFLWYTDGWGMLYSVPIFFLWILWHGYWADARGRPISTGGGTYWWTHPYIIELPFRIFSEGGFFLLFPLLVAQNPPFWDLSLTNSEVGTAWLKAVTFKHVVGSYLLLFFAHLFLRIRKIRSFFRLPEARGETGSSHIVLGSVLLGLGFWFVDSIIDFLFFSNESRSLLQTLLSSASPHNTFMRSLFFFLFIAGGLVIAHYWREREAMRERAVYYNRILRSIRNVNQLISQENDPERLLQKSCELLTETQGYYSVFIFLVGGKSKNAGLYYSRQEKAGGEAAADFNRLPIPHCVQQAMNSGDVIIITEPEKECGRCLFKPQYGERGAIAVEIRCGEHRYGVLRASVPKTFIHEKEEHELLKEVAGDIAFAIQAIETRKLGEQAERDLFESREKYRILFEKAADSVLVTDLEGRIISVNQKACENLGYSHEQLKGLRIEDVDLVFNSETRRKELIQRLLNEKQLVVETFHQRSDGSSIPMQNHIALLELPKQNALVNIARDISDIREARKSLERELQEKEVLLKEIHHRVKNNLNVVASLLRLQSDIVDSPEGARTALRESTDRIYSMALVHEQIYREENLSDVDMTSYIRSVTNQIRQVYDSDHYHELIVESSRLNLDLTKAIPCGIIINELITNCFKYAFSDGKPGRIAVRFHRNGKNRCELEIADNGIGLPKEHIEETVSSLGLQLVHTLARQLEAEMEIEIREGTRFTLSFEA